MASTARSRDGAPEGDDLELELEPRELIRRSDLVMRTGNLMLGAGTSSLRVRQAMQRTAARLGLGRMQAQITFTTIIATVYRDGIFRTQVGEVTTPAVNADRIRQIQTLTRHLPADTTPATLAASLDDIEKAPPLHPRWLVTLAVGLACVSVGFLNQGSWRELLAVSPAAMLAFLGYRRLLGWRLNLFGAVVGATLIGCGLFLAFTLLLQGSDLSSHPRVVAGFVAVTIFLVPGFPLFTGALDLARLDLQAGIGRMVYAGVVMLSISIGAWVVATMAGIAPYPVPPLSGPPMLIWGLRVVASFLAVFGWALMFNSPWRESVASGLIAVAGSLAKLVLVDLDVTEHIATFVGALVIGVACHGVARWLGLTRLIMLVPTLLVMIPGSPAVQTLLHFNNGDILTALTTGINVVLQVLAMVCGLVASMMVLDPGWAFTNDDQRAQRS